MLTYGFRFYETRKLYAKGANVKQARIWMGKQKEIGIGVPEDIYVTIGRGQYDRLKANINVDKVIKAPLTEGAVLGTLTVQLDDKTILEKPVVALQTIPEANIFSRAYDSVALRVKSFWNKDGTTSETKPETKSEVKQEAKSETKPEVKQEAKSEINPELKSENSKIDAKSEVKEESKTVN